MTTKPVKDLQPGDRIKSRGYVLEVLDIPWISTKDDLFARAMYVFNARITEVFADAKENKRVGDSGKLVYGLQAEAVMATIEKTHPALPEWTPANNGAGKRSWFLIRGRGLVADRIPVADRYRFNSKGDLIRYASYESAQRAADTLNAQEGYED
jgi:hypothetical protein